jgi:hypothetical protein
MPNAAKLAAEDLDHVMNGIEYAPHTNPHRDLFSVVWNVSTLLFNERYY